MNIAVIGNRYTGKTSIAFYLMLLLQQEKKNICYVDGTENQGVFGTFIYNDDVESLKDEVIVRQEISFYTTKNFLSVPVNKYDYCFVELDRPVTEKERDFFDLFLVCQDCDRQSIMTNKKILKSIDVDKKIIIVINKLISNMDEGAILNELIPGQSKRIMYNEENLDYTYINYSPDAYEHIMTNRLNGVYSFSRFDKQYKQDMFTLVDLLNWDINAKDYDRMVK